MIPQVSKFKEEEAKKDGLKKKRKRHWNSTNSVS